MTESTAECAAESNAEASALADSGRKSFILSVVQPGLASPKGASESSLAPLFADAFANFDVALAIAASVLIVDFS